MPTSRAVRRSGEPPSDISRRRVERRMATGRKSDDRWQRVLAGASKAFREIGYAQTTLEDVAAEAGISRATLYRKLKRYQISGAGSSGVGQEIAAE